ncbi:hypothetical protein K7432_011647 [Basidiobolus ranarum]|uniref:CRIB domain-containing protein n=1 Tax=Basidiobolus ranarum TaxID=34480 RepID=A0ABR2VTH9_9FUNG
MLSDKGLVTKASNRTESLKCQLPQKRDPFSTNDSNYTQDVYLDAKASNLKKTFTSLFRSVTGYFKAPPARSSKKIRISSPSDCIHFGHAGIDPKTGEFNSYANTFNGPLPGDNLEAIMRVPTKQRQESFKDPCYNGTAFQSTKAVNNLEAKKRREISAPLDLLHITHVSISTTGEFIGLPKDWQAVLKESSLRC